MSMNTPKPNFLFRAVMIFFVAVLITINVVLIYSTNNLMKDIDLLNEELAAERLECEKLRKRLEMEMTEENIEEEVKELGYRDPTSIEFNADIP